MEKIIDFINRDQQDRIDVAVVGDAMIDQYYDVEVTKISPEFPIPVMKSDSDKPVELPGGAANVAAQFSHFGFNAFLHAFLDPEASNSLRQRKIVVERAVSMSRHIPRKKRYYCGEFPLTRYDVEAKNYGLEDFALKAYSQDLLNGLKSQNYACVIFSDYDKGVFKHFDSSVLKHFPITIVDPKTGDLSRWKGCTVFKPNESEALRLSGKTNVEDAGRFLVDYLGSAVVITQAGSGVSVFEKNKETVKITPKRKFGAVESVIGAGDCFICFLAMALCRGFSLVDAADIAFHAGVLYVRNKHNKPLTYDDLLHVIDPTDAKILNRPLNNRFVDRDFKLAFTNGCFDLFHAGHLHSLKFAKMQADKLVVAVNTDESVSRLKPGRPIVPLAERIKMLAACEYVDYVVPFSEDTPLQVIQEVMPDVVVKGSDYEVENICGFGIVPEIIRCPLLEGISTSKIVAKIQGLSS